MKKLPRFLWTGNGTWTRRNGNPQEQRNFSNVSATKSSRRRRVCALHPTVFSSSSPSFTPQLYHSPRTSLNTHKCPDFKMQKRRKKVWPFYWEVNCTAFEDKRNNVTVVKKPKCVQPKMYIICRMCSPRTYGVFLFWSNELVKISAAKWNDIIYPVALNSHVRLSCLRFSQCPMFVTFPVFVNGVGTYVLRLFRRRKHILRQKAVNWFSLPAWLL